MDNHGRLSQQGKKHHLVSQKFFLSFWNDFSFEESIYWGYLSPLSLSLFPSPFSFPLSLFLSFAQSHTRTRTHAHAQTVTNDASEQNWNIFCCNFLVFAASTKVLETSGGWLNKVSYPCKPCSSWPLVRLYLYVSGYFPVVWNYSWIRNQNT